MIEISGDPHTVAGVNSGKYIRSIRSAKKKDYARAYLLYVLKGRPGKMPQHREISYKAAQSVRRRLDELFAAASL